MLNKVKFCIILFALINVWGCTEDENGGNLIARRFSVKIENVSQPNTINSPRANGAVPLSPGVFAVFAGANQGNPVFMVGQPADEGTERIAEDGFPMIKDAQLSNMPVILSNTTFESMGGPDNGPAIFPGESATFTFTAKIGDNLQIQTMFVQSNDWFYAFDDDGLALFEGFEPISGDVTSKLVLYDAGTEQDTAPGTGPYQKPVQSPMATNVGPDDSVNRIEKASERHPDFNIPATSSVIKITVTPL